MPCAGFCWRALAERRAASLSARLEIFQDLWLQMHRRNKLGILAVKLPALGLGKIIFVFHGVFSLARAFTHIAVFRSS
jgi:hypothetical protein